MKNIKFVYPFIAILLAGLFGCSKEKATVEPSANNCFSGEIIKSVKKQKGIVYYDPVEERYSISSAIPGTFDSVDMGFICEASIVPKEEGLEVFFSGNYYSHEKNQHPYPVGTTLYFLDVASYTTGGK